MRLYIMALNIMALYIMALYMALSHMIIWWHDIMMEIIARITLLSSAKMRSFIKFPVTDTC